MSHYILYCDGSFKPEVASCAWRWLDKYGKVILQKAEKLRYVKNSYCTELAAAVYGLERIPSDAKTVTVVTDSMSIINIWEGKVNGGKSALNKIWEDELLSFKELDVKILFRWVRGHANSYHNIEVDKLAGKLTKKKKKRKSNRKLKKEKRKKLSKR